MRYSTSEMAKDVLELLEYLKWTEKRQLHIVGISMGGMISQELALMIPERIASLSLVSTAARLVNTIGFFENLWNRVNLLYVCLAWFDTFRVDLWLTVSTSIPRAFDAQIAMVKYNLFSQKWLAEPDCLEYVKAPFPTNGDRIGAAETSKRQNPDAIPKYITPTFVPLFN